MTSKLTREETQAIISALRLTPTSTVNGISLGRLADALSEYESAMDSEPAIIVGDDGGDALAYRRLIQSFAPGTKLYRHAQPPVTDKQPAVAVGGYRKLFTCSGCGAEGLDEPLESRCHCGMEGAHWIEGKVYLAPQPAPVVPEEINFSAACNLVQINGMAKEDRVTLAMKVWNACRAAMLNGGKS